MCAWCNCQGSPGIAGTKGSPVKQTGVKGGDKPTKIAPQDVTIKK